MVVPLNFGWIALEAWRAHNIMKETSGKTAKQLIMCRKCNPGAVLVNATWTNEVPTADDKTMYVDGSLMCPSVNEYAMGGLGIWIEGGNGKQLLDNRVGPYLKQKRPEGNDRSGQASY